MQIAEERTDGRRAVPRRKAKDKRKDATIICTSLHSISEDESETIEKTPDHGEELQAWCSLEECEHEQWQGVISRRDKQR